MSIAQGFGDVRSAMPWWLLGALVERGSNDEIRTAINKYPQAAQVTTVTVTDQGDDDDVIITINGVDVTINTGTGASLADIGADLAEAINAEPLVRGQVTATFDTATLTLTGNTPGMAFTVSIASDPDSVLSAVTAVTAAAAAAAIDYGRAVVKVGSQNTDDLVAQAASALFTAQVITITPSGYVAGAVLTCKVWEIRGAERILLAEVSETSATSLDATLDALATSLNAALPAASVLVASEPATATTLTFTAEVAGLEIEADLASDDSGASVPTSTKAYTTGPSESTSFHRAFRGITLRDQGIGAETVGGTEQRYPANSALAYVRKGMIAVESSEAITSGADVFVELGVSADNGKFFATDSATRIGVARSVARWERDANTGTGNLAALRLM